ncbi:malto-oligosyltrehalose trehalohydrolase [Brevundimonas sp.]|uniref:malto-oligosyltrehalose trehalohydrolase n=1 Tax=Brevundimonas sp. TaxID=1871086 RepID=UPI0037BED578
MTARPEPAGPQIVEGGVRFRIWAPQATGVTLELETGPVFDMADAGDGWREVEAPTSPGAAYRFRLEDGATVPDPASRRQREDVHGWSVVTDPDAYVWRTPWGGRPWREAVIYEAHVGVLGGFVGVDARLADIAALGFTALQLMPVAAVSGHRNWGYDGVLPYAPTAAYGSPEDLKRLIDAAHALDLMVFLDVVYNHFGPDGNHLGRYAADFFHESRQTPWGGAIAFDRAPVARFFIDNARYWIEEFRFDGLRFDAVHAIGDNKFLDRLAAEVRAAVADRPVHLILENENNDPDRLAPGRFDAQWNDDFHNVLHVLLTGETDAYYAAFADHPTDRLARCLAEGFVFQGEDGTRGASSGHLPASAFVSFLQNHDQVGNRALGERLISLVTADRMRAAVALHLLCPQIPLVFMGEEEGSTTPFLFFTDFHDDLADAVREGRRREFAKFAAFSDPEARARIPDPNAPDTFQRSRPEPGADSQAWRAFYTRLLNLRRVHVAPHTWARATGATVIGEGAVVAGWDLGGARLTFAINLGDAVAPCPPTAGEILFEVGAGLDTAGLAPASFVAWREDTA